MSGREREGRERQIEPERDKDLILVEDELLREGFTQLPNAVLRMKGLSPGAKLVYAALLSYAWQTGSCFPGQKKIAEDLDISERSVRHYIRELKERKLLKVIRRGLGKTNIYFLPRLSKEAQDRKWEEQRQKLPVSREKFSGVESNPGAIPARSGSFCRSSEAMSAAPERNAPAGKEDSDSRHPVVAQQQHLSSAATRHAEPRHPSRPVLEQASDAGSHPTQSAADMLRAVGVHRRVAEALAKQYPRERIRRVVEYVRRRLEEGWQPEQSVAAWVVAAIKHGYRLEESPPPEPHVIAGAPPVEKDVEERRLERARQLGIDTDTEALWRAVLETLRSRGQWTPVLGACFLRRAGGPGAYEVLVPHAGLVARVRAQLGPIAAALAELGHGPKVELAVKVVGVEQRQAG